jgi:VanZ family protein
MPEQPWRNPRPAPQMNEVQPRLGKLLVPPWLRAWWPALAWAVFIFIMSTDMFSAAHTGSVLHWIFYHLDPTMPVHLFNVIHHLIRKSAHFTEYFIFCMFLYRGVRGDHRGWRWSWGLTALLIAALYASLDEIHQAFVASRTASPYDSLLDSIGAFFAFLVLYVYFHYKKRSNEVTR